MQFLKTMRKANKILLYILQAIDLCFEHIHDFSPHVIRRKKISILLIKNIVAIVQTTGKLKKKFFRKIATAKKKLFFQLV